VVDGRSVAQVEPDKKREVRVRINGDLVARAPRPRVDKTRTNDDIRWLLVHAAGELGEQGMAIDPAGGGSRNPANTGPLHDQRIQSMWAVARWRRLRAIWLVLTPGTQRVLSSRYQDDGIATVDSSDQRGRLASIPGLRGTFGELTSLAWDMAEDQLALKRAVSRGGAKRDSVVAPLRRRVEAENRRAHLEWLDAERDHALEAECPPRDRSVASRSDTVSAWDATTAALAGSADEA
jgi:hypothetical protein